MNKIIPYDEFVGQNSKCFIRPDGKILQVHDSHEEFARFYCNVNLKQKEKRLYDLWKAKYNVKDEDIYSDFLVKTLFYDKVNVQYNRVIATSSPTPHVKYYNYYLMDWIIGVYERILYDEEKGVFYPCYTANAADTSIDGEAKEELDHIKAKTLLKDREVFLK